MKEDGKSDRIAALFRNLRNAELLPPCSSWDQFVPPEGSPGAPVAIVGEAPGAQEEKAHRPFVGLAGKFLRQTIEEQGLAPDSVWITNVVKCRPTRASAGRVANRAPTKREADLWAPWLMRELEILLPRFILCLGNLAASTLIHHDFKMGSEHGRWFDGPNGASVLATYHPSYVMRQIGPSGKDIRRVFTEDVRKVAMKARA